MTSLQRFCKISNLTFSYFFPFTSIVTLHCPDIGVSVEVDAIVTFLLDEEAEICNLLKAFSLMKLSELQESIRAVILFLPLIKAGTEAYLRAKGQAAVMVHREGL